MPDQRITRRLFAKTCAGAMLLGAFPKRSSAAPLSWASETAAGEGAVRRYRADAQVIVLSVPLLRRSGVGDGAASWREGVQDGGPLRLLEFTGRSDPARAAGLKRFGFIRELSRPGIESIYFGLMTSSPEESAAEARKALHSSATEAAYSAIEGRVAPGAIQTAAAQFTAPVRIYFEDRNRLIDQARRALAAAPTQTTASTGQSTAIPPFLQALADALMRPGNAETRYVYGGRLYRLKVERSADEKETERLRNLRLLTPTARAVRISGRLRRETGGKEWEFRLWIEEGSPRPLPLRIEYQPKSYLRLSFEAEPPA